MIDFKKLVDAGMSGQVSKEIAEKYANQIRKDIEYRLEKACFSQEILSLTGNEFTKPFVPQEYMDLRDDILNWRLGYISLKSQIKNKPDLLKFENSETIITAVRSGHTPSASILVSLANDDLRLIAKSIGKYRPELWAVGEELAFRGLLIDNTYPYVVKVAYIEKRLKTRYGEEIQLDTLWQRLCDFVHTLLYVFDHGEFFQYMSIEPPIWRVYLNSYEYEVVDFTDLVWRMVAVIEGESHEDMFDIENDLMNYITVHAEVS
ncbi:MAG: hypothetical protein QXX77_08050 [Candidatus Methanosuratincola sp.]